MNTMDPNVMFDAANRGGDARISAGGEQADAVNSRSGHSWGGLGSSGGAASLRRISLT